MILEWCQIEVPRKLKSSIYLENSFHCVKEALAIASVNYIQDDLMRDILKAGCPILPFY